MTRPFLHDNYNFKQRILLAVSFPDNAKPSVRSGRKAAGLGSKIAELPKEKTFGKLDFFYRQRR
jgi:hypothetical protein